MNATAKDVSVNRAREQEAPACLALLPEIAGAPAELLIARKNGEFAGAGAVLWASWAEPAGFNVLVRVLASARRQGVGRSLIAAAADLADGETDGLWSFHATPHASPAAQFLEACGFVPRKREHYFQAEVAGMLNHIVPIAQRYRERGHFPQGADVVSLREAGIPLEEIAWLIAREFNNSPAGHMIALQRRLEDSADYSFVARLNGELAGVLLWHVRDGVASADVRVVARRWRSGWPNLLLMEQSLLFASAQGLQQMKFFCDETLDDTRKLARRGDGKETDIKARHYLAFG